MNARDTRRRLANLHAYAGLCVALHPGECGTRNPTVREGLNALGDFLKTASSSDVLTRSREIEGLLRKGAQSKIGVDPLRDPEAIGRDFIALGRDLDLWRYGVPYGWLAQQFRPPILGLPTDLPAHVRVGLGHHAGSAAVEEATLLDDTCYLAALTKRAYDAMYVRANRISEPRTAAEARSTHDVLTALNINVGTLARLTVITAAGFVESFVNSVGASEAAKRPELDSSVLEQLKGTRKGRYLSLEFKLERFPALIRTDGLSPLHVIDEAQRTEPFRRFLTETKEVRDAAMHYAPTKAPIICTPQEWAARATAAMDDAIALAQAFWAACYPEVGAPDYLYQLDIAFFRGRADKRVQVSEAESMLHPAEPG